MALLISEQNCISLEKRREVKLNGLEKLVNKLTHVLQKTNHNWHTRKSLAKLNDAALKDIGLSKADVDQELNKPLWK